MSIAYYNGEICKPEEVRIPLSDRAVFFGDGIYDAAIGCDGKPYLLEEHINRFLGNRKRLGIPLPLSENELYDTVTKLCSQYGDGCFFLYFQLSRYAEGRKHACHEKRRANLLMTVTPAQMPRPDRRLKLICYPDMRYGYCDIKTLNLLPSVMASSYAEALGADEAIFVRDGVVTECAHSNISIIRNGELITHPKTNRILPGIMRGELIRICREMGINCREEPFTRDELFRADEVIVSSSTKLFSLVDKIDGIRLSRALAKKAGDGKASIGEKLTNFVYFSFVKSTK